MIKAKPSYLSSILYSKENFAGFEIKIADYNSQALNCIQILPLNKNQNYKNYKFILRDPNRYNPIDKNKFTFYFGKISFNLLSRVNEESDELTSEILTPFVDVGVRSPNETLDIKSYRFGKIIIDEYCIIEIIMI